MSIFNTSYQEVIYKRTYSRYLDDEQRREEWSESVGRYADYFRERVPSKNLELLDEFEEAIDAFYKLDVVPSMRAFWSAGPSLDVDNLQAYNCSYLPIRRLKDFAEVLYILMQGTGVGFSVERQFINELPKVPKIIRDTERLITVSDSKRGWAEAFLALLSCLYGTAALQDTCWIPKIDYSLIRPKGSRLKTTGGRASGPEPLKELFDFTIRTFKKAAGRKLNSLEVYDIVCKVGECVVVGGVRRSALICLTNLSDRRMAGAKNGEFWLHNPQRSVTNNSVAYTEKPDMKAFMEEWTNLMVSGSGERGIFNREGANKKLKRLGRIIDDGLGTNPCGEILLRPYETCNLTEVVIRPNDSYTTLRNKVKYAVILGTLQATLTDFHFVNSSWKENLEEERLLGVSLTGLKDHKILCKTSSEAKDWLGGLQFVAHSVNKRWAKALGINPAKAITCVKPSGTVSQLVNTSSGIHPRYSQYYIRRVRVSTSDPLCQLLITQGVPHHPEVGQEYNNATTFVFEFPQKAPDTPVKRGDETALEQLTYWAMVHDYWCDHNPSQTIYVKGDEWLEVGAWVYKNFDKIIGLSFLPYDGGVYPLAPYEEIDKETYRKLVAKQLEIDWDRLSEFETEDMTTGSRELACKGGSCEL